MHGKRDIKREKGLQVEKKCTSLTKTNRGKISLEDPLRFSIKDQINYVSFGSIFVAAN
jgi:hypothetical protein